MPGPIWIFMWSLYAPIRWKSLSDGKYVFVIFDYYTRFTWVFFLKDKTYTFIVFGKFYIHEQNNQGLPILIMRSDYGTKFKGEFIKFSDQMEILYNFSALRTPSEWGS